LSILRMIPRLLFVKASATLNLSYNEASRYTTRPFHRRRSGLMTLFDACEGVQAFIIFLENQLIECFFELVLYFLYDTDYPHSVCLHV
jgi:hypothetical protein